MYQKISQEIIRTFELKFRRTLYDSGRNKDG